MVRAQLQLRSRLAKSPKAEIDEETSKGTLSQPLPEGDNDRIVVGIINDRDIGHLTVMSISYIRMEGKIHYVQAH